MGNRVSPLVQLTEVGYARPVCQIGRKTKREIESFEIVTDCFDSRIVGAEPQFAVELDLDRWLERGGHMRHNDLCALRIQVAAEPLEIATEPHHISAKTLLCQQSVWRPRLRLG